jgi:hypothetical protein
VGEILQQLGSAVVGRRVQRYWPEEGGWWTATLTGYSPESCEHQLTYNKGQKDESFEWADLSEFHNNEIR